MYYIYHLEEDNKPFYIGKTKNNPKKRENQHKTRLNNKLINLVVIDTIDSNWKYWESWYIELYKSWGFELLNKNKGGGGPDSHNNISKQKLSQSNKGKQISDKHKQYLSLLFKGKNRKITWGDKISQTLKGHPVSNITKDKISQANKGNKHSSITKNKISQSKKGKSINLKVSSNHKLFLKQLHSKPIYQYDKHGIFIKEWNSTQEAANYLNIQKGHICNALNGRSKTCCGFIWRYK